MIITPQKFYKNAGYLANPLRRTNIEVEMPQRRQIAFIQQYAAMTNNIPQGLINTLAPRGIQNRPGYILWNRIFSKKKNVFPLLKIGFVLGLDQDVNRIRALISQNFFNDFNNGFVR